jgi:bifunctional NMN adenylyltransferase/nudix hydrolase
MIHSDQTIAAMPHTSYELGVFIGRFQPFHNGHRAVLDSAFRASKRVLIIIGSSYSSPRPSNPWSAMEREEMIRACLTPNELERVDFHFLRDYYYAENCWNAEVQQAVHNVLVKMELVDNFFDEETYFQNEEQINNLLEVALFGFEKDESSYYLRNFPQWDFITHPHFVKLNATDVRAEYFRASHEWHDNKTGVWSSESFQKIRESCPEPVVQWLTEFAKTDKFQWLMDYHAHVCKEEEEYAHLRFRPIHVTTDAVVVKGGHILLVRRGLNPGKGMLALPGGYMKPHLTTRENALEELREETRIRVKPDDLRNLIVAREKFDHPKRNDGIRKITDAYFIDLDRLPTKNFVLPAIKGGDDAKEALWMPIADIFSHEDEFFEDHFQIIRNFISVNHNIR